MSARAHKHIVLPPDRDQSYSICADSSPLASNSNTNAIAGNIHIVSTLVTPTLLLVFVGLFKHLLCKALEHHDLWTLRFRLATVEHLWTTLVVALAVGLYLHLACITRSSLMLSEAISDSSFILVTLIFFTISGYTTVAAWSNRIYLRLRWLAWSGPSRTGIPPGLVRYVGNKHAWREMDNVFWHQEDMGRGQKIVVMMLQWRGIVGLLQDPTNLLRAAAVRDQLNTTDTPGSGIPAGATQSRGQKEKEGTTASASPSLHTQLHDGIYHPISHDQPASLLWGTRLGFHPRLSRAILSVPAPLLLPRPLLPSTSTDGRGVTLAMGILGRNKGLAPASLVCNLTPSHPVNLRVFEEDSIWYPRPSKTLRGYYRQEMQSCFGTLGEGYVAAATELALILCDAGPSAVQDWLESGLEQQDLDLNVRAWELGATPEDLDRLYRGSYAAMLISLNTHQKSKTGGAEGRAVRPELEVFVQLCNKEGMPVPAWTGHPEMVARRRREVDRIGEGVLRRLVEAVV